MQHSEAAMNVIDENTLNHWQRSKKAFVLVDTLPPTAFAKEHLPGAINIMSDDILARAPELLPDKQQTIVVYCASVNCKRAGLSAGRLVSLGYSDVHEFSGGKRAWREAGLPFDTATQTNDA